MTENGNDHSQGKAGALVGVRVSILPGLPAPNTRDTSTPSGYPEVTPTLAKILRGEGAEVSFASTSRDLVSYNSVEVWLPLAAFAVDVFSNGLGSVLGDVLMRLVPEPRNRAIVHVDWRVSDATGASVRFKFDGPAESAVQILGSLESISEKSKNEPDDDN